MTSDNMIIVQGGSFNEIQKALKQWIALYHKDLDKNTIFKLYRKEKGYHIIQVPGNLDNCKFNYLVNYLCYPNDIGYKVTVTGITIAQDPEIYDKVLIGRKIQVFIPDDDKEYDIVYVVSDYNHVYKVDFGGKTTKLNIERDFQQFDIDLNQLPDPEVVTINNKEIKALEEQESRMSTEQRFKIIFSIAIICLIIASVTRLYNYELFCNSNFILSLGIAAWFYGDYQLLQINRFYLLCFSFAFGLFCYGFLIKTYLFPFSSDYIKIGYVFPISFLITQKPLRLLFKFLLKREPVLEKPIPTFWDGVYSLILLIAFVITPFLIFG